STQSVPNGQIFGRQVCCPRQSLSNGDFNEDDDRARSRRRRLEGWNPGVDSEFARARQAARRLALLVRVVDVASQRRHSLRRYGPRLLAVSHASLRPGRSLVPRIGGQDDRGAGRKRLVETDLDPGKPAWLRIGLLDRLRAAWTLV